MPRTEAHEAATDTAHTFDLRCLEFRRLVARLQRLVEADRRSPAACTGEITDAFGEAVEAAVALDRDVGRYAPHVRERLAPLLIRREAERPRGVRGCDAEGMPRDPDHLWCAGRSRPVPRLVERETYREWQDDAGGMAREMGAVLEIYITATRDAACAPARAARAPGATEAHSVRKRTDAEIEAALSTLDSEKLRALADLATIDGPFGRKEIGRNPRTNESWLAEFVELGLLGRIDRRNNPFVRTADTRRAAELMRAGSADRVQINCTSTAS